MTHSIDPNICKFDASDSERYTFHTTVLPIDWAAMSNTTQSVPANDNENISQSLVLSEKIRALSIMTLDRIRLAPKESVIGENIFTLSLAPQETVALSQKSYTKQTSTLEDAIGKEYEINEEESSTNSSELTDSTQRQINESNSFSLNTTVSGKYGSESVGGSVEASVSAGYQSANSLQNTNQSSVKRAMQATKKAAAKARTEHKTTFKVESENFTESSQKRIIKNINTRRSLMLKYYKVFQKYACTVERYDLRLCWCPVVKSPGRDVAQAQEQIDQEDTAFMDLSNWAPPGARPRPADIVLYSDPASVEGGITGESKSVKTTVALPDGYQVKSVEFKYLEHKDNVGGVSNPAGINNSSEYAGRTGRLDIYWHVGMPDLSSGSTLVFLTKVTATPTSGAISSWEAEIEGLRAKEAEQRRIQLEEKKKKREQNKSYSGFDPITELMRRVVYENIASDSHDDFSEIQSWHDVFDWEGMCYTLYPNWWNAGLQTNVDGSQSRQTTFLNASWAKLQIPVFRGKEALALKLITNWVNLPARIEAATQNLLGEIATMQRDKFNEVQGKFEILDKFEECMPTDGTYLEPVLGECDSTDNSLSLDIAIDQAKRALEAGVSLAELESASAEESVQ